MSVSPRTSIVASGRQRRSAVRYSNLEKATSSPILTKPNRSVDFDDSVHAPHTIGVIAGMQGWRKTMEDRHALCTVNLTAANASPAAATTDKKPNEVLPPWKPILLAVFDGHRGTEAADLCATLLPRALMELVTSNSKNLENLLDKEKLAESYVEVDATLRRAWEDRSLSVSRASSIEPCPLSDETAGSSRGTSLQSSPHELSVSTIRAPEIVITGTTSNVIIGSPTLGYYCLNVGDSRGYLICKRDSGDELPAPAPQQDDASSPKQMVPLPPGVQTFALSVDHRTTVASEVTRIEAAGGYVVNGRVNGKLSVTRAFGDFDLKPNLLDVADNPLICTPDVVFQPSLPPSERLRELQRHGTALFLDREKDKEPTEDTLSEACSSLTCQEQFEYDVAVVGCDGVWELQNINDIAVRVEKKLAELLPQLLSEKPSDVEKREAVLEAGLKDVVVDTLTHACAVSCSETGGSLGADNLSLGIVLHLIQA